MRWRSNILRSAMMPKQNRLFEEILHRDPAYVGSYYHLAKLLERVGEDRLAKEWYEKGMIAAKKADDNHSYNELQAAYEDLIYWVYGGGAERTYIGIGRIWYFRTGFCHECSSSAVRSSNFNVANKDLGARE